MSNSPRRIRRQVLGLRLNTEPYYRLTEQDDTRLVLQSPPDANTRAGQRAMLLGGVVALLTPLIIIGLVLNGSQPGGDACFGALIGWPFLAMGFLIWNGGRAIASTVNTMTVDTTAGTVVFQQTTGRGRTRSQTLQQEQVARLRLRPRWFVPRGLLVRRRRVVALELITDEEFIWLVDSSAEQRDLEPVAEALAALLGVPLEDTTAAEPV